MQLPLAATAPIAQSPRADVTLVVNAMEGPPAVAFRCKWNEVSTYETDRTISRAGAGD